MVENWIVTLFVLICTEYVKKYASDSSMDGNGDDGSDDDDVSLVPP